MSSKLRCVAVAAIVGSVMCAESAFSAVLEPLFRVSKVQGDVTIQRPDGSVAQAQDAHAYPYGSKVVVPQYVPGKNKKVEEIKPEINLVLGYDYKVKLSAGTEAVVGDAKDGFNVNKQSIELTRGMIATDFTITAALTGSEETDAKTKAGLEAVTIKTPLAEFFDISERNEIRVKSVDGFCTVGLKATSTTIKARGGQFVMTSARRGSEIEFYGHKDYTRITCVNGQLGIDVEYGVDDNGVVVVEKTGLKRRGVINIWRTYADASGRMAISVMILQPDGAITAYAFLEGEKATGITRDGTNDTVTKPEVDEPDFGAGNEFEGIDIYGTGTDTDTSSSDEGSMFDNDFDFGSWE